VEDRRAGGSVLKKTLSSSLYAEMPSTQKAKADVGVNACPFLAYACGCAHARLLPCATDPANLMIEITAIALAGWRPGFAFSGYHDKLHFLEILADYDAVAIENSRFVEQISRMSITDEYTGLFNARYLHRVLDDLVACADQRGPALTVAFVDLDNFKLVVGAYRHLAGSRVLKKVWEVV
jgi:predicted signal transduction protein with EAL and GGDEF domain